MTDDEDPTPIGNMPAGKVKCRQCPRVFAKRYARDGGPFGWPVCGWCYRKLPNHGRNPRKAD